MSDIEKKISLKGLDQVLSDFQKLQNEVSELKNRNRELRQTSEGNSTETMSELKGMANQYLSVAAAVGIVTTAVIAQREEQERLGRVYDDHNQKLVQQLSLTNQLGSIKAIDSFVRTEGYEPQKARSAIIGVGQGAPNLPFEQQRNLAQQLMEAQGVMSPEQMSQTAEITGRFAKLGFGERSDDLAIRAQQLAGKEAGSINNRKFFSNVETMIAGGVDSDTALAMNVAAVSEDLGPKWAGQLNDALLSTDKVDPGDSPIKRKWKKANAAQRLEMARDPRVAAEIFGGKTAQELGRGFGQLDTIRGDLSSVNNIEQKIVADLGASDAGREALEESRTSAIKGQDDLNYGEQADPWNAVRTINQQMYKRRTANKRGLDLVIPYLQSMEQSFNTETTGQSPQQFVEGEYKFLKASGQSQEAEWLRQIAEAQGILVEEARKQSAPSASAPSRSIHGE